MSLNDSYCCIHTFSLGDKRYAFSGNSLMLAEVSTEMRIALEICSGVRREQLQELLTSRFGRVRALQLKAAIEKLDDQRFFADLVSDSQKLEHQIAKEKSWQRPVLATLELVISGNCNLRCKYCYAEHGQFGGAVRQPLMPLSVAEKALGIFLDNVNEEASVVLLGGEPFLHPDLPEIIRTARTKLSERGLKGRISLSTNGTIYNDLIVKAIAECGVGLSVSIDGDRPSHDAQRPFSTGRGSFDTVIHNLEKFMAAIPRENISLRVTCTRHNTPGLSEFFKLIREEYGDIKVDFSPVMVPQDSPYSLSGDESGYVSLRRFLVTDELRRLHSLDALTRDPARSRRLSDAISSKTKRFSRCEFGVNLLSVTPDAQVYPCVAVIDRPEFCLGSLESIVRAGKTREVFQGNVIYKRSECRECWARYLCGGGCVAANLIIGGDPLQSTPEMCRVYRAMAEATLLAYVAERGAFQGGHSGVLAYKTDKENNDNGRTGLQSN